MARWLPDIMEPEEFNESVMLMGGSDDMGMDMDMTMAMAMDTDDQLSFDFGMDDVMGMSDEPAAEVSEEGIVSNQIVVLQTQNGIFLRFKLNEVPEKKKGAVGVRGIKLGEDDAACRARCCGAVD